MKTKTYATGIAGFAALLLLGMFFAVHPALLAPLVALLTDPHAPVGGVMLASMAAVDPEMVKAELKRIGNSVMEPLAALDEKTRELQFRLQDVERKAARTPHGAAGYATDPAAELRRALDESPELMAMRSNKSRRAVVELPPGFFKAQIVSGDGLALPDRLPGIVGAAQRRLSIRSLLPAIPVTSGSLQYTQETSSTNNAAPVSETSLKPESGITYALQIATVVVIAHWIKTSLQVLSDTPALQAQVEQRLIYDVRYAEELQLLRGSGVGANISGLMTNATAYNRAVVSETKIDTIRRAITQLEDTNCSATGVVLHPFDWEAISLIKDTTGQYVAGSPGGANPRTLWNIPCVVSSAMTDGDFLVADFQQSALLLDRMEARIDISTEDADNFQRNLATIRGEERIGLAVLRPGGLIKGTFA